MNQFRERGERGGQRGERERERGRERDQNTVLNVCTKIPPPRQINICVSFSI